MAEFDTIRTAAGARAARIDEGLRAHMNKVYGTMSVGMLLTALAAWAIAGLAVTGDPTATGVMLRNGEYLSSLGQAIYASPLRWVVMLAPLGMVFLFGAALSRLSAAGAQLYFWVYAALVGTSLSSIFLVTAIAFAGLSLWGYTTKKDISGWGSFLVMGVIGLIVAMILNMLIFHSSGIQFAVLLLGPVIFAGLTAYDTQNIKGVYLQHAHSGDSEWLGKAAIMGALQLYLDFINMFIFLLQLLGNRE